MEETDIFESTRMKRVIPQGRVDARRRTTIFDGIFKQSLGRGERERENKGGSNEVKYRYDFLSAKYIGMEIHIKEMQ